MAGVPWHSLGEVRETDEQFYVALANTGAVVFLPFCFVIVLTLALAGRFIPSFLLALTIPISLMTVTWSVSYREPIAERRITFFGRLLSTSRYALARGDSVSADPIKDSFLLIVRPRWYTLALISSTRQKSHVIMKSNDKEELEKMAQLFNSAIARALSAGAS